MTVKDFKPTQELSMPKPNEDLEGAPIVVSLKALVSRHKSTVETLLETTNAISAVLHETISASDETIRLTRNIKEEAENQAAMMIFEAQGQGKQMIDEAERDCRNLTQKTKADIQSTLKAAIQQAHQALLGDLENLEQPTTAQASEEESPRLEFGHRVNGHESQLLEAAKAEPTDSEFLTAKHHEPLEPLVSNTDVDEDEGPGGEEIRDEGVESLQQTTPIDQIDDTPETIAVGEEENSSQTELIGQDGPDMEPRLYTGHVELAIRPNKVKDEDSGNLRPFLQIAREIRDTSGATLIKCGLSGDQFLIDAHFGSPVSLDEVLAGVTDWEEVDDQEDKVNGFLKGKRGKRILVTL